MNFSEIPMPPSQQLTEQPQAGAHPESIEDALLQLLDHRYGDGLVYLREDEERALLSRAMRLGLVSPDGYITPKGQHALAQMSD